MNAATVIREREQQMDGTLGTPEADRHSLGSPARVFGAGCYAWMWLVRLVDFLAEAERTERGSHRQETGDDALVRSVYGEAKYERLRALKRARDNVFRLNQNIRP